MSNESSPGPITLFNLLDCWNRGELTREEVVSRWPSPDASCMELASGDTFCVLNVEF